MMSRVLRAIKATDARSALPLALSIYKSLWLLAGKWERLEPQRRKPVSRILEAEERVFLEAPRKAFLWRRSKF